MDIAIKHRNIVNLRSFLYCMPIVGFALAAINDLNVNLFSDYSNEPAIMSIADAFASMLSMVLFALAFTGLFYIASRVLFSNQCEEGKASESDQALLHGLSLMIPGGGLYLLIYAIYDSPVRMIFN